MGKIRKTIAKNILFYRKQLKFTQEDLAIHLNVKKTSVSSWERGANSPDIETLFLMCDVFGITVNEMFGVDGHLPAIAPVSPLSPAEQQLVDYYRIASDDDKAVVDTVLRKYRKPTEKSKAI